MKTLFVATQSNQLLKAKFYLEKRAEKAEVLFLYTAINPGIINEVANFSHQYFLKIHYMELPLRPNNLDVAKCRAIHEKYNSFLKSHKFDRVFMFSHLHHYRILSRLCEVEGVESVYLEEGLGTYQKYDNSFLGENSYVWFYFDYLKRVLRKNPIWHLWSAARMVLRNPVGFLWDLRFCVMGLFENDKSSYEKVSKSEFSYVYHKLPKFTRAEVAFPHLLDGILEAPRKIKTDPPGYDSSGMDSLEYNEPFILFLDQRYNFQNEAEYWKPLIADIEDYAASRGNNCNVLFKLHPRTNYMKSEVESFINRYSKSSSLSYDVLSEGACLAEQIISNKNCIAVLGLTSSSLIYAKGIREDIPIVSLGLSVLGALMARDQNSARVLKRDMALLRDFPFVEHYNPGSNNSCEIDY